MSNIDLTPAIEAAARAWHDEIERSVVEPGDELVFWDYEDEDVKEHYLTTARANIEAAAPIILRDRAEQYRHKAKALSDLPNLDKTLFRMSIATLLDMADELDRDADELTAQTAPEETQ